MNALYISYDGAADSLGQSQVIPYVLGLSKKNITIVLLTFEKKKILQHKELIRRINCKLNNINWVFLRYHKTPSLIATIFDLIYGILVGLWILKKKKIKIIHGRSFIGSVIALFLKKIFRVKVILDIRGFWPEERVEAGLWNRYGWLYKISKCIEKVLILDADEIVVLTDNAKREMKKFDYLKSKKVNINVIPTCVDISKFMAKKEINKNILNNLKLDDKFVISYIGSISTWYMPEEMFKFFKVIQQMIDGSFFLILTKEDKYIENILQKHKDDIYITNVDHSLIPHYLSISKIGLAFYKPGYSRKACCPVKFGEYLACGLPVIINRDIGDSDEIILREKVGVIVNEYSLKEYERAVEELKVLLSEGDALRKRCRVVAEKYFSLEMGVERYWEIYRRLEEG